MTNAQVVARLRVRINLLKAKEITDRNIPDGTPNKSFHIHDDKYEVDILEKILGDG